MFPHPPVSRLLHLVMPQPSFPRSPTSARHLYPCLPKAYHYLTLQAASSPRLCRYVGVRRWFGSYAKRCYGYQGLSWTCFPRGLFWKSPFPSWIVETDHTYPQHCSPSYYLPTYSSSSPVVPLPSSHSPQLPLVPFLHLSIFPLPLYSTPPIMHSYTFPSWHSSFSRNIKFPLPRIFILLSLHLPILLFPCPCLPISTSTAPSAPRLPAP